MFEAFETFQEVSDSGSEHIFDMAFSQNLSFIWKKKQVKLQGELQSF